MLAGVNPTAGRCLTGRWLRPGAKAIPARLWMSRGKDLRIHHSTALSLHVSRAEILRHVAGEGIQKGEQVRLLRIGEMKFEEQV
jgi:hypothetical protein